MDKAAYEATTRTVGKWIVPLAKAQHIERELVKISEKAEHLAIALVTGNDAIESLTRDLRTVIEVARSNMPRKHGTIERLAANLPENVKSDSQSPEKKS